MQQSVLTSVVSQSVQDICLGLLAFKVSVQKSGVILVGLPLCVMWPFTLASFNIFSSVHLVFWLLCGSRIFFSCSIYLILCKLLVYLQESLQVRKFFFYDFAENSFCDFEPCLCLPLFLLFLDLNFHSVSDFLNVLYKFNVVCLFFGFRLKSVFDRGIIRLSYSVDWDCLLHSCSGS